MQEKIVCTLKIMWLCQKVSKKKKKIYTRNSDVLTSWHLYLVLVRVQKACPLPRPLPTIHRIRHNRDPRLPPYHLRPPHVLPNSMANLRLCRRRHCRSCSLAHKTLIVIVVLLLACGAGGALCISCPVVASTLSVKGYRADRRSRGCR